MREIARLPRNTVYDTTNFSRKENTTKLPIVLCAITGIIIGTFGYKFANEQVYKNSTTTASSENTIESDVMKESLFKIFGIDFYNPMTILNTNYPYFKTFYDNQYLDYVAQQEKEALEKKITAIQDTQKIDQATQVTSDKEIIIPEPTEAPFKEASSSITFEDDVDEADQKNNPVVTSGEIKIKNETKYTIDINKLLNEPLKLKVDKKGAELFVYHTHTTESFLKNTSEINKDNIPSRTMDNKYNVVRVGEALISNLKKYNINVLHNKTVHDKDYNNSYIESLKTLTKYVNDYPSLQMTIDLHRDAIADGKLRVVKQIDGKNVAQIMFVIGTDSKLSNPNWKENLKLAIKIQARLNEICPGLAKPIYISKNRYNQHLTNGSLIVEIGGDGNVIDECVLSTKYLAQAINDVLYKK